MVYKLVLGDWSDDGHGKYKDFLFDCNYDVSKVCKEILQKKEYLFINIL